MTELKFKILILDDILIDEKPYKNILVYDNSYKTLFGSKPLHIRFDKDLMPFIIELDKLKKWYCRCFFS